MYMMSIKELEYSKFIISLLPKIDSKLETSVITNCGLDSIKHGKCFFYYYHDEELMNRVERIVENALYIENGKYPFSYATLIGFDSYDKRQIIFYTPCKYDDISKVFFTHELHHALEDTNNNECRDKRRFSEIIPLFSEMVSFEKEKDDSLKKEMVKSRMILLKMDLKALKETKNTAILYYYSNYYYALCLYDLYLREPKEVMTMVSKVLKHFISTKDLLGNLDLFDVDNSIVKEKMNRLIKVI